MSLYAIFLLAFYCCLSFVIIVKSNYFIIIFLSKTILRGANMIIIEIFHQLNF